MPRQPDQPLAVGIAGAKPLPFHGIGREVGRSGGGKRSRGWSEQIGQTAAGQMRSNIQFRIMARIISRSISRGVARYHVHAWKRTGEKGLEPWVTIEHATIAGAHRVRNQSREHNFVADTLLSPDQQTS